MEGQNPLFIKCAYCGHENPAGHRFCGMCSRALPDTVRKPAGSPIPMGAGSARPAGGPTPALSTQSSSLPKAPTSAQATPGAAGLRPASAPPVKRTRHHEPSHDVSYLLEDHEGERSRLPFMIVIVIVAAVLGVYLWQSGRLAAFATWFKGGKPKVEETQTAPEASGAAAPAKTETAKNDVPAAEPEKAAEPAAEAPPKLPVATRKAPAVPVAKPAPPAKAAKSKHHPAKAVAKAPVVGAAGACETRITALQKAANRGDAKARVALGGMYARGECVSRDLPTAYRFLALALRADRDNPEISAQLEALWKQMSPAERQVAVKAAQ